MGTVIIGGGPAGLGPLVSALQEGRHEELLASRVMWLEQGDAPGPGCLGGFDIMSDTRASVLLECLDRDGSGLLRPLRDRSAAVEVARFGDGPLPLPVAARFLAALGARAQAIIDQSPSRLLTRMRAFRVVQESDGQFLVFSHGPSGVVCHRARRVVYALGGRVVTHGDNFETGAHVFTAFSLFRGSSDSLRAVLTGTECPQVVILGASHSGFAAATMVLDRFSSELGHGRLRILARRRPKVFYPDLASAHRDGYDEAGPDDVCPITGRVHRLGGMRLRSRDLLRGLWGLGGATADPRVRLDVLSDQEIQGLVRSADVVITALGFTARTCPLYGATGRRIALSAERGNRAPLVDGRSRLLRKDGTPVVGAFGVGLGSGLVPSGAMGGEPSFSGQTNGLWLYQNDIGKMLLDRMVPPLHDAPPL